MSDSGEFSLLDLFREEVRSHAATLGQGLLELEEQAANPQKIEPLMRAAHSIKGAARIVGIDAAVGLAHVMEDAFVAAQQGRIRIEQTDVDLLLQATDLLGELGQVTEATAGAWGLRHQGELAGLVEKLQLLARGESPVLGKPDAQARDGGNPSLARRACEREGEPDAQARDAGNPSLARRANEEEPEPKERLALVLPDEPIVPGEEAPLFDLFREELRSGGKVLYAGVLELNDGAQAGESLVRTARGIKGAARIVGIAEAAELAGALEGAFAAVEQGQLRPDAKDVGTMLETLTVLVPLVGLSPADIEGWREEHKSAIAEMKTRLEKLRMQPAALIPHSQPLSHLGERGEPALVETPAARMPVGPTAPITKPSIPELPTPSSSPVEEPAEAVVRVTAQSLNRLMSLAGESLVQARWLQPFSLSLQKLKKHQDHLAALLDRTAQAQSEGRPGGHIDGLIAEMRNQTVLCRQVLAERMGEFEEHAAGAEDLNSRLYREVIVSRMRPFADGAHGFPRLVRDMARRLDKQVRLEIDGLTTEVDRDILEKLEAPLTHLLRNAVDHGIELPEVRRAKGKPEQGRVHLEVRHRAGSLAITVGDDGGGIDAASLRRKVVERGLSTADMTAHMGEAELLEFLFLPGFTTTREVTEYSGRGVGLDVVQTTIRKVGGSVRITSRPGQGTTFHLQLPLTLSVVRAVLVTIAGEPYAFPHNRIDRLLRVPRGEVRSLEHRHYIVVDGQNVGLVLASQMLDLEIEPRKAIPPPTSDELPVLLMSDDTGPYGLIVEAFRGEQDLVVRTLDPRLGKVPNISAAALLDDGSPVLIADVEDLIRSMDHFIQAGSLRRCDQTDQAAKRRKRVLVVDDSITVREVERQLLRNAGYDVAVAVDGKDGWNQLRGGPFDLVVTDVDMPRMTGLDLVKLIRDHEPMKDVPIIIVSYKDREEERLRGLHLGANFYLTKSSFHDDTFLQAVADLIGDS